MNASSLNFLESRPEDFDIGTLSASARLASASVSCSHVIAAAECVSRIGEASNYAFGSVTHDDFSAVIRELGVNVAKPQVLLEELLFLVSFCSISVSFRARLHGLR